MTYLFFVRAELARAHTRDRSKETDRRADRQIDRLKTDLENKLNISK